ncbi:MAG: ABC transporter ATP-binding protein [Polyangiaceae bacterium]
MADPVLRLEGVVKDYGERVRTRVLFGIDLTLAAGEIVALIGPSGSGKSTLLNLVGLLDRPTGGRIILAGEDTTRLDDERLTAFRGRTLGFVFQFHHLLPAFTARENVMIPAYATARRRPTRCARRRQAPRRGRPRFEARRARDGSLRRPAAAGGHRARARARSALVLADEPTGNLDTASADEVFDLLRRVSAARNTTVLVVTHDPRIAARAARIVSIVDGRLSDPSSAPA